MIIFHDADGLKTTSLAKLSVLDVDNSCPTFSQRIYNVTVDWCTASVDDEIAVVLVTGNDRGQRFKRHSFKIIKGNERGLFAINPISGAISFEQLLLELICFRNSILSMKLIDILTLICKSSLTWQIMQMNREVKAEETTQPAHPTLP